MASPPVDCHFGILDIGELLHSLERGSKRSKDVGMVPGCGCDELQGEGWCCVALGLARVFCFRGASSDHLWGAPRVNLQAGERLGA